MKLKQIFIILAAVLVVLLNLLLFIKNNNSENISINKSVNNQTIDVASSSLTKNNDFSFDISTSTNENGWTVYRNNTCGFEISFPVKLENATEKNTNSCDDVVLLISDEKEFRSHGVEDGGINLHFLIHKELQSLEDWYADYENGESYSSKLGKKVVTKTLLKVNKNNVFVVDFKYYNPVEGYPQWTRTARFNIGDKIYELGAIVNTNNGTPLNQFNEILNSITIINN